MQDRRDGTRVRQDPIVDHHAGGVVVRVRRRGIRTHHDPTAEQDGAGERRGG